MLCKTRMNPVDLYFPALCIFGFGWAAQLGSLISWMASRQSKKKKNKKTLTLTKLHLSTRCAVKGKFSGCLPRQLWLSASINISLGSIVEG